MKTEDKKYFLRRDKTPYLDKTVKEIYQTINIFSTREVIKILKELDYPFLIDEWNILMIREIQKNGDNISAARILGKYIAKMDLLGWRSFTFKDSFWFFESLLNF